MAVLVALAAMPALVLQGCDGSGNGGVEQDLREQITMLEGRIGDARSATAAADATRMTAEAATAEAVAAQTAAVSERDAAIVAKGAAEQARAASEAAQAEAEAAQVAAKTAQMTAEDARAEAERMRVAAEAARNAAAGSLAAAEIARDAAKDAEAAAKVAQTRAEAAQMSAEADSREAMAAQMEAEETKMAAEEAQAAAEAAQMAAETKLAGYKKMTADAMAAQKDAEAARDAARAAEMAAKTAQATAKIERDAANTAKMAAEAARATAEAATTAARAAQRDAEANAAMYKAQLNALRGEVEEATEADRNAAAKGLLGVLANNDVEFTLPVGVVPGSAITDPTTDAPSEAAKDYNKTGLVGTRLAAGIAADDEAAGTTAATYERQRVANDVSALVLRVSSDGRLLVKVRDDDAYGTSATAPDMIEGWRGAMLTRDHADSTMDTVVVYSNIGRALLNRYESMELTLARPRRWPITPLAAPGGAPVTLGHIPWSVVERPDTTTAFAGTGDTPELTFRGTVHDIPGTFSCTTGGTGTQACKAPARYSDGTVSVTATTTADDDGASVAATPGENTFGAWTFVPDYGVPLRATSENYLTFGWWLMKDAGGNPADFLAFATGTRLGVVRAAANSSGGATPAATLPVPTSGVFRDGATVHTSGTTIRGSATYSGAAAGQYAMASATADSYEGGQFTADATLTVDFDADLDGNSNTTADATSGVALSGVIDNFMTGSTARPDWMVNLMVDNDDNNFNAVTPTMWLVQNPAATPADERRMLTTWSTGAAAEGEGTWSATWYGGVGVNAAGNAIDGVGAPDAVIGMFDASIGDAARLQGSFGAMKDME